MDFTLSASPSLPTGNTIKVFPRSAFPAYPSVPSGAPPASGQVFTGVMGASSLTVTGLNPSTRYVATTNVGGTDKYVTFQTPATAGTTVWRYVTAINGNLPVAAATGKYIANTAVASINSNINTAVLGGARLAEFGSQFRLAVALFSTGGAGTDPTGTLRVSLYDVTSVVGTTGATLTPGTEIAGSVLSGLAPTPRGALIRGASASFVIADTSKDYAPVLEVVGAAIPASTSLSGTITVQASS